MVGRASHGDLGCLPRSHCAVWTVPDEVTGIERTELSEIGGRVGNACGEEFEIKFEQVLISRERQQARLALGLTTLLANRDDLHGVCPLADLLLDRVLWCT